MAAKTIDESSLKTNKINPDSSGWLYFHFLQLTDTKASLAPTAVRAQKTKTSPA